MATGRLLVLPSTLILLLYIRNLLAVVEEEVRTDKPTDGTLSKGADGLDLWTRQNVLDSVADSLSLHSSDGWGSLEDLHSALPVTFDPPTLDFGELAIGMPVLREVTIVNPTNSLTLQLMSISGDVPDFETSFFKSKVLRAGETTSFDIVFLPRSLGPVVDTLHIHSSLGNFDYEVKGTGLVNPFRLKALKGARIPINATYSPLITMYNPYAVSLQVLEVYSTGERLQLQLPTGVDEASSSLWEIRPYETKPIAKLNFYGTYPSNHTAFVRIKTDHPSKPSIVLPVEVEVCETTGLFLSRELLDFGMLKSGESKSLPIYLWNAGSQQVEIRSIVSVPDNAAVKIEYANTTLKSGSRYTKVAVVTFSVDSSLSEPIQESGLLKVWAEDRSSFHQLTVPYEVDLLNGSLVYDKALTLFRVYDPPFQPVLRNISLLNQFDFPVVVYSAKLSSKAQELFSVVSIEAPYVIPANSDWHSPLVLKFQAQSSECLFNTSLRLSTNASYFNIPLQCYDGRLEYDFGSPDIDALEFGLLSNHDSSSKIFSIRNPNPMKLSITEVSINQPSTLPDTTVQVVPMPQSPDGVTVETLRPPYILEPGQILVFRVNITRPQKPGTFSGEVLIHSSLGKILPVPVNYKAVTGNIQTVPTWIKFEPVFPFSTSTINLRIQSTYTQPMPILSLDIVAKGNLTACCPGDQIEETETEECEENESVCDQPHPPVQLPAEFPTLKPSTTTRVGNLVFDPRLLLPEYVYTGAKLDLTENLSSEVPTPLSEEVKQLDFLWETWQTLVDRGWTWFNFSVVLSTEAESNHVIPASGSLQWPHLSSQLVSFPLTIIGNSSEQTLQLHNPSNTHPIVVEPVLLSDCSSRRAILRSLAEKFDLDMSIFNLTTTAFSVFDHQHFSTSSHSEQLSSKPVQVTRLVLGPSENRTLRIGFSPDTEQWSHGLLLLRNNLTSLDYVQLQGQSSRGFVTVSGVHPGGPQPLFFEFTKSMMEDCNRVSECGYVHPYISPMTLPRTLQVHNSGPSPMTISRASLSRTGQCQTSGFRISNCEKQFIVYPNKSRKIEIECTPDYTLSRITDTLLLHTSSGVSYEFPLLCALPHHMLSSCYLALPHMDVESLAAYVSVPVWFLALVVMVVVTMLQVNWHANSLQQKTTISKPAGIDVPKQATGGIWFDLNHLQSAITEKMTTLRKRVEAKSKETNTPIPSSYTLKSSYLPSKPATVVSDHQCNNGSSEMGKTPASPDQTEPPELMKDSKPTVSKTETESTESVRPKPMSMGMRLPSGSGNLNVSSSSSSVHQHSASLARDSSSQTSSSTTDYQTGMRVERDRVVSATALDNPAQQPSSADFPRKSPSPAFDTRLTSTAQEHPTPVLSVESSTGTRRGKQGRKQPSRLEAKPAGKITPEPSTALSPNGNSSSGLQSSSVDDSETKPEHLVRKESDESIQSSESDHSGSSTNGSDNSPDTEESPTSSFSPAHQLSNPAKQAQMSTTEKLVLRVKPVQHQPSYTKEPGTGQRVPVKENGSDDGSTSATTCIEDGVGSHNNANWPHHAPAKKEAALTLPVSSITKPRSKKKLRAQLKREERQKRRQKEKEGLSSSKAMNGSQESIDKESVASNSTNSTENFEDETPFSLPSEAAGEQQSKGKVEAAFPPSVPSTSQPSPSKAQEPSITNATDDTTGVSSPSKANCSSSTPATTEQSLEDSGAPAEKNGSPADLLTDSKKEKVGFVSSPATVAKEAPPRMVSTALGGESTGAKPPKKLQEIYSDVFSCTPDKSTYNTKSSSSKRKNVPGEKTKALSETETVEPAVLVGKEAAEDKTDDGDTRDEVEDSLCPDLHSVDTVSALDSAVKESVPPPRSRPQKLDIADLDTEDGSMGEPVSVDAPPQADSVECDGAGNIAKTTQSSKLPHTSPHEIAASLLSSNQSILRRNKHKSKKEKSDSPEDMEMVPSASIPPNSKPTPDKYPKTEVEHHRTVGPLPDHPSERRSNFSVDAPPYVPPHPPPYPYNYPPPGPHHRRPLLQPPHRMPSPPFDYSPMRPYAAFPPEEPAHCYNPEQVYERRVRKRSDYGKYHHHKSYTPSPSHHYGPLGGDLQFPREHHRPPLLGAGSNAAMYDSHPDWNNGAMPDHAYVDVAEDPRATLPHGGGNGGGRYREIPPGMSTGSRVMRERSMMHQSRPPAYDVPPSASSLHAHGGSASYNPDDDSPFWDHRFGHGSGDEFALAMRQEREQAHWKMRRQMERERRQQHHSEVAPDMRDPVYRRQAPDPIDTFPSADLAFSDIPYHVEDDSPFGEAAAHSQRPLQHSKHRRQLLSPPGLVVDRDDAVDMSTLIVPLNRAPGSTRERSMTSSSTLLSDVIEHSAQNQVSSKWPLSPTEDRPFSFGAVRKERNHSWQTPVWGFEKSPLTSALQEQHLSTSSSSAPTPILAPTRHQTTGLGQTSEKNDSTSSHKPFSGNTYDLFDGSGRGGIWSFNSDELGFLSWANPSQSQERSD